MKVRSATAQDAAEIATYWNPQIRETSITFTTEQKDPQVLAGQIETCQDEGRAFLVAHRSQCILGHAFYGPFRNGPGYARTAEHTVILTPEALGQGVAHALMDALEGHARAPVFTPWSQV